MLICLSFPLRKSHKPSTPILPERARFAGPYSVVFPTTDFQPPRHSTKAQAVEKPLARFSP